MRWDWEGLVQWCTDHCTEHEQLMFPFLRLSVYYRRRCAVEWWNPGCGYILCGGRWVGGWVGECETTTHSLTHSLTAVRPTNFEGFLYLCTGGLHFAVLLKCFSGSAGEEWSLVIVRNVSIRSVFSIFDVPLE